MQILTVTHSRTHPNKENHFLLNTLIYTLFFWPSYRLMRIPGFSFLFVKFLNCWRWSRSLKRLGTFWTTLWIGVVSVIRKIVLNSKGTFHRTLNRLLTEEVLLLQLNATDVRGLTDDCTSVAWTCTSRTYAVCSLSNVLHVWKIMCRFVKIRSHSLHLRCTCQSKFKILFFMSNTTDRF